MMAVSFALVFAAVEDTLALFSALEDLSLLTAFDDSRTFATLTRDGGSFEVTRFTLSFMTELGTGVGTVRPSFSSAYLTARMGLNVSFILRLLELATKTVVLGHGFVELKLALGTTPSEEDFVLIFIFVNIKNPGFDTFKVH
jgi:hypothetical protein